MIYIQYLSKNERWELIRCDDILPLYEISDRGRIRKISNNRYLRFCNPMNEKGYCRVTLKTKAKSKKFFVHRLVMKTFSPLENYDDCELMEVNHKDGNPSNNKWINLEWSTRKENAEHAAINGFYKSCEDCHKSTFTNDTVHEICRLFESGKSVSRVIDELKLPGSREMLIVYINRIRNRYTWCDISKDYSWNAEELFYKTYDRCDIIKMCTMLKSGIKMKEIADVFSDKYDDRRLYNVLKKINQGKLYRELFKQATTFNDYPLDSNVNRSTAQVSG